MGYSTVAMASMTGFLQEWHNAEPFVVAHTSGSTGAPKSIRLLKSDMRASATATNRFFGIHSGSVLAIPLSADYIAGKMMAVRTDVAGCRLLELPVSNDVDIKEHVDLLAVVPSQIKSLLLNPDAPQLVRNLLIGGAPLNDDLARQVTDAGFSAYLGYGMTETCSHVALRKIGNDDIFHAMPGISFSTDSRGCLIIESRNFSWKKLVTNDVVELVSAQSFRWLGRFDNVINSGGIKLHPEELEKEYRERIPSLPPFYLIGETDAMLGQRLVMVAENPDDRLLDNIREIISDHRKTPKRIISVTSLPQAANGKLRRILPAE